MCWLLKRINVGQLFADLNLFPLSHGTPTLQPSEVIAPLPRVAGKTPPTLRDSHNLYCTWAAGSQVPSRLGHSWCSANTVADLGDHLKEFLSPRRSPAPQPQMVKTYLMLPQDHIPPGPTLLSSDTDCSTTSSIRVTR